MVFCLAIGDKMVKTRPSQENGTGDAIAKHIRRLTSQMRVDLSGHTFVFPQRCACCNGAADRELTISASKSSGKRVIHTATNAWDVPYCSGCLSHVSAAESARTLAKLFTFISIISGLFLWFAVSPGAGFVVGTLGVVGTITLHSRQMAHAKAICCPDCVCVDRAMTYVGWHGSLHRFDVASSRFAADLMAANARKIVNLSPEARNMLGSMTAAAHAPRAARRYRN